MLSCRVCGAHLVRKATGAAPIYCSQRCKMKAANERYGTGVRVSMDGPEYVVNPDTGCWEWQHRVLRGYPMKGWRKQHHVYWARAAGRDVPEGHDVHHTCGTRHCVNPDHLEVKPALKHRREHGPLTPEKVATIRELLAEGVTHRVIAERIGCSKSSVSNISANNRWAA